MYQILSLSLSTLPLPLSHTHTHTRGTRLHQNHHTEQSPSKQCEI